MINTYQYLNKLPTYSALKATEKHRSQRWEETSIQ